MTVAGPFHFESPGTRRRVLRTIAVVAPMLWILAPAGSRASVEAPLPTSLVAEPFSTGGVRVIVDASRDADGVARICIEALALTEDGPEFQTAVYETACPSEMRAKSSYRFALVRRVASISGRVHTVRIIERRQRQADGEWVGL
ncbi:MAG TPA: hypothetical protein VMZ33_04870, partial [Candidatus Limnocylindrales bacterium]|nr:hypothetical protein [Candidatus Limnocylindrales bacterium]